MSTTTSDAGALRDVQHHPLIVRITHWTTALAVLIMIGSGWRIYDQEPIIGFIHFPIWATLGGEPSHSQAINNDTGTPARGYVSSRTQGPSRRVLTWV